MKKQLKFKINNLFLQKNQRLSNNKKSKKSRSKEKKKPDAKKVAASKGAIAKKFREVQIVKIFAIQ